MGRAGSSQNRERLYVTVKTGALVHCSRRLPQVRWYAEALVPIPVGDAAAISKVRK